MKNSVRRWRTAFAVYLSLLLVGVGAVLAFQVRPKTSRFDVLVIEDQTESLDVSTTPVASLASSERLRGAWDGFKAAHGSNWAIYLDRRCGAPMLVEGQGIPLADRAGGARRHHRAVPEDLHGRQPRAVPGGRIRARARPQRLREADAGRLADRLHPGDRGGSGHRRAVGFHHRSRQPDLLR